MSGSEMWRARLDEAATDRERCGLAWSYLLAALAASPASAPTKNRVRREVAEMLIAAAESIDDPEPRR